jgi:kynurenine formamidase
MAINSVLPIAERGIAGHGVLLDVARYRGVDHLQAGEAITLDDLLKTAERQAIEIKKRDILLVRTGWLGYIEHLDESQLAAFQNHFAEPGLRHNADLVNWFYEMEIPLLASDNLTNECWKNDQDPKMLELHVTLMSNLGVLFSEINTLDPLAVDCEQDRQYDFLYAAGPLKIVAATGAPMNPLAMK